MTPRGGRGAERGSAETEAESSSTLQAQVPLAAVKADKTLAELAEPFRVLPSQINDWKHYLLARAANV
jgi:hypothetical protein